MRYFVYILDSEKDGKKYIGSTSDINRRLESHNSGNNTSTRFRIPFRLIYGKEFEDKVSAIRYEFWLKKQKGGSTIKKLIDNFQKETPP